ncbi:MAG: hypothetical protein AAB362_01465 [Patescibacteria group bacterium]
MRNEYFVEQLLQRTKEGAVEWFGDEAGNLFAESGGVKIRLSVINSYRAMELSLGPRHCLVMEPFMHVSQAPLGFLLRFFRGIIGTPIIENPKTIDEISKENLRKSLLALFKFAKARALKNYDEASRKRIKDELFSKALRETL